MYAIKYYFPGWSLQIKSYHFIYFAIANVFFPLALFTEYRIPCVITKSHENFVWLRFENQTCWWTSQTDTNKGSIYIKHQIRKSLLEQSCFKWLLFKCPQSYRQWANTVSTLFLKYRLHNKCLWQLDLLNRLISAIISSIEEMFLVNKKYVPAQVRGFVTVTSKCP